MQAPGADFERKIAFLYFTKTAKMFKNTENRGQKLKRGAKNGNLRRKYANYSHHSPRNALSSSNG
jgi:tRNA splicing endonuclease